MSPAANGPAPPHPNPAERAEKLLAQGDLMGAEAAFRALLAHQPGNLSALINLAVIHLNTGRPKEALDPLLKARDRVPEMVEIHNNLGVAFRMLGDSAQAEACFARAAALRPEMAEAHNNLGAALADGGRLTEAAASYRRAIALRADYPDPWRNLGLALAAMERRAEALEALERALALNPGDSAAGHRRALLRETEQGREATTAAMREILARTPDFAPAHNDLGRLLMDAGQWREAERCLMRAIALAPGFVEAHNNLGVVHQALGQPQQAEHCLRQAAELAPDQSSLHLNLALLLLDQGRFEAAHDACQEALAANPDHAATLETLARVLMAQGKHELALGTLHSIISREPDFAEAHNSLGNLLLTRGARLEAIESYQRALTLDPNHAHAHNNLGAALRQSGRFGEAESDLRLALGLNPAFAPALNNLGSTLCALGRYREAMAAHQRAMRIDPCFANARGLLHTLQYLPSGIAREWDYFQTAVATMAQLPPPEPAPVGSPAPSLTSTPPAPSPANGRRLRIAYLSSDFRDHPVAHNISELLAHHDRSRFEIFCYAEQLESDAVTTRLRGYVDCWRTTNGMDDAALAERMRADGIDIGVYLAGHYDHNRLTVARLRPAPVQVSFHNGATTGLAEMDYWLTDAALHPESSAERFTETLVRLPVFYNFRPLDDAPPPTAPPHEKTGAITFGSFNNPVKINPETLACWGAILKALPTARLLVKYRCWLGPDSDAGRRIREGLRQNGADPTRVELLAAEQKRHDHLAQYAAVDIALDPFPYTGATSTFQALWMGVPVVSLTGDRFLGRMAADILTHAGLPDLAVETPEAYVGRAVALASDFERLRNWRGFGPEGPRAGLRERLAQGPLCDGAGYARAVESAFERMFEITIGGGGKG